MPKCNHCQNQWSWIDCMRKAFRLRSEFICRYCGAKQYQTQASMRRTSLLSLIPLLLLPVVILFNLSIPISLAFFFIAEVLYLSVFPFVLELTSKHEPLW
ncbi:TIGR04104 family putative zinc finger protein [Halobacillus litoralis]|uniref:TIGR04104 family putative zinc finger protein n=1 Tax=Halobacillus litoralis TaxID=45668 RepID=UPI001CFC99C3|nr:TIGR04104 family putative zinc finger protein [Halobacillus litoralis]